MLKLTIQLQLSFKQLAQLTVLHIDKDYDLIASITGQPVERLSQP